MTSRWTKSLVTNLLFGSGGGAMQQTNTKKQAFFKCRHVSFKMAEFKKNVKEKLKINN